MLTHRKALDATIPHSWVGEWELLSEQPNRSNSCCSPHDWDNVLFLMHPPLFRGP